MHPGRGPGLTSRRLGQRGGVETVTLSEAQMPNHTHNARSLNTPFGQVQAPNTNTSYARADGANAWIPSANLVALNDKAVTNTGGSQAHTNLQPFLTMSFIIALQGLFPSRS